jgi:SpoVK/Ycf46/Vps4 family AAA+-type ATPase
MKIARLALAFLVLQSAAALSESVLAQQLPRPEIAQRKRFDATTARQLTALSRAANKAIRGTCALLSGASSADRTLAAQTVADQSGTQLYRVDLSSIVSKYAGETEKNLNLIFERAANAHSTLLFDEADALFGKRSDVRDSHDRYANLDTALLLQRIEGHPGVVLLATNAPDKVDPAVAKRCAPVRATTTP